MISSNNDIVLLSTADWDNPFWTNKQHVAVELARRGHKVLYIDSLGLRKPSVSKRDIKRIIRRLLKAIKPPRKVQENIWVWSPITLPWNNYSLVRLFNRVMLSCVLKLWCKTLGIKDELLWTYNPLTTELLDVKSYPLSIYHCVDEIKAQPGMPIDIIERAEKTLVQSVDYVFATSPRLTETRKAWNDNVYYFSNVSDYNHFSKAMLPDLTVPEDLKKLSGPVLGFIGAISGYKLDLTLIKRVALSHPEWTIALIGEVGEGDPWTNIDELKNIENIYFMGPKKYQELPGYLKGFDVALLPNQINEYTDSMFPMKFFEYLSAGKPVVSVDLKAIRDFHHVVKIAETPEAFITAIEEVLAGNVATLEQRLNVAKEYTYQTRTEKMFNLINEIKE